MKKLLALELADIQKSIFWKGYCGVFFWKTKKP